MKTNKQTKKSLSISRSAEIAIVNLSLKANFQFRTFVHQFLKMFFLVQKPRFALGFGGFLSA